MGTDQKSALQAKSPYIAFVGRVLTIEMGHIPHHNYPVLSIPSRKITFEVWNKLGGEFPDPIEVIFNGDCKAFGENGENAEQMIGRVLWMVVTRGSDNKYYREP